MSVLLHSAGHLLSAVLDDFSGEVSMEDLEEAAVAAAVADLPDVLRSGDTGDWPVDAAGWVEAWDGTKGWPGTHTCRLWRNALGNVEVVTSLYWW